MPPQHGAASTGQKAFDQFRQPLRLVVVDIVAGAFDNFDTDQRLECRQALRYTRSAPVKSAMI